MTRVGSYQRAHEYERAEYPRLRVTTYRRRYPAAVLNTPAARYLEDRFLRYVSVTSTTTNGVTTITLEGHEAPGLGRRRLFARVLAGPWWASIAPQGSYIRLSWDEARKALVGEVPREA